MVFGFHDRVRSQKSLSILGSSPERSIPDSAWRLGHVAALTLYVFSARNLRRGNNRRRGPRGNFARRPRRQATRKKRVHGAVDGNVNHADALVHPSVGRHLLFLLRAIILQLEVRMNLQARARRQLPFGRERRRCRAQGHLAVEILNVKSMATMVTAMTTAIQNPNWMRPLILASRRS